ncbi:TolC family protein [Flavobacterium kingsejongi]|uniref:Transporter n=1 Tax=Flavobacterium kingsejongi TaxID=1678728 RepID=A0A2S1LSU5_9FLAO|nr:TolC family protein [Flavobacterium kingsejongi]AWG26794.1 transporter [Flavobacterium kingsejongi]
MKIKNFLLSLFFLFGISEIYAQEKSTLTLDEAINLALTKSTEANLANTKVASSQYELQTVKNNQYPTLKISGQYQRLTEANVNFKINTGGSSTEEGETTASPKVNQLVLGQASLAVPLFSGFKIRNSIKASENMLQAETYNAKNTKEQLAMNVVILYVNLYKAQQSVALINENIVSAKQRVKDFTAMEENGLIARNDLLKAQLQASNIQLSLDEAKKQVTTITYQLATLLKLPENTQITPSDPIFGNALNATATINENDALEGRSDLESLRWQQKASEANIKIAQANYYPSLSLTGGYVAFNLQNVLEVTNAINFGIGLSYDLSSIFKNNKDVKLATSRASETRQSVELLTDRVKVEVQEAQENYNLMIKQNKVYVEATGQATENYRIVKDKYDNGLSDTNDLLEADVQQLQSKINEAYSKADITQSYYALLNASGKLTNSFNLTKN